MKNFYAQSLSIFMLIALLACALSCARSLLRRCGAYLVARTLEHRDSRAIADRGERVSLVVADPELCASGPWRSANNMLLGAWLPPPRLMRSKERQHPIRQTMECSALPSSARA